MFQKCSGSNNPLLLFKTKRLRRYTFIQMYNWFVVSMTYYGLALGTATLSGDPHMNFLFGGLIEMASNFAFHVVLWTIGRIWPLVGSLLLGSAVLLTSVIIGTGHEDDEATQHVITGLVMTGRFMINGAYILVWLYAGEIFPTPLRNTGVGLCSSTARIGGILAPILGQWVATHYNKEIPMAIFGTLAFLAAIGSAFLPETRDRVSPDTIQELEEFHQASGRNPCACFSFMAPILRQFRRGSTQELNEPADTEHKEEGTKDDASMTTHASNSAGTESRDLTETSAESVTIRVAGSTADRAYGSDGKETIVL